MKLKIIKMDKFPKNFMVWQAICCCGLRSAPFVTNKMMNSYIYIKECLEKRILPLVRKHIGPVLFWPDLASCHYSKKTLSWLQTNDVPVVPKIAKPPNCPELRPVETFWALVKKNLKLLKKPATNFFL